ncbi:MAG TPA: antibiotic biosynthesis monooxygenase [Persephonella sp.]|uniref:Antibiotic biosynthesis monooxygenase n=1 Tax=Persephonella marina (strain DSM 14350 / EX-H1) TaxID=123214 RepID=C0QU32_PERMH|nr:MULTISPECIES: antibiotic biosynthesis monooxygenase [Persephonella]ACO04235.1 antibiotic biosynthesis monooxygenase [Persephonella marina EX-H1]HCB70186.1 antibiotic biosynthesis monooxygenase [Persephonella sp.]
MIVIMTKFFVNPKHREDFKKRAIEGFGEKGIKGQKGFIKMNVLEPKNFEGMPPNDVFIIETYWESEEDFIRFTESEAFKKAHEEPPPKEWFTTFPVVEVYEVIKEVKE